MKAWQALILAAAVGIAACAPVRPDVGASVGTGGPSARAGVESGRVSAGVSTSGTYARAKVVDTDRVDVGVGTGGPSASVKVAGPVRVGVGLGGWRLGF